LLAVPLLAVLTTVILLVTGWRFDLVMLVATVYFLPFVPAVFRYSRVIWMHFDRAVDPTLESEQFLERQPPMLAPASLGPGSARSAGLGQPMLGPHDFADDAQPRPDPAP
jgi:hypothetical protein